MEEKNEKATFTFKADRESLNMTNPMGQSYTAKLDGTDAPYKGVRGINSVSIFLGRDDYFPRSMS
jgi:hypothetical protein